MKALIVLVLISISGCAALDAVHAVIPPPGSAKKADAWIKPPSHFDKYGYEVWDTGEYLNKWEKDKADAQNQAKTEKPVIKENPQQTACIYFGNAYVQAINIRNQWSFADPKAAHDAILSHVQSILVNYPQFNAEGIVDNVLHNPALRPPVGGNPFMLQMVQMCMQETKRVATKP